MCSHIEKLSLSLFYGHGISYRLFRILLSSLSASVKFAISDNTTGKEEYKGTIAPHWKALIYSLPLVSLAGDTGSSETI